MDAKDRKRTKQDLKDTPAQATSELEMIDRLAELTGRLLRAPGLRAALEEVLEAAIALHGADMGNVQIYNPSRRCLEIVAQRGFKQDFLDFFREVRADDDSACARALKAGRHSVIEDVENDPLYEPYRRIAAAAGYRAVQSTPLISRHGELLGVLSTHFSRPHRPSDPDLKMLDLYARHAADFLERIRMEEVLRQRDQRFSAFAANVPAAMFAKDLEGRYTLANPLACQTMGRPAGIVGMTDDELLPGNLADILRRHDLEVVSTGQPVKREETVYDRLFLSVKFPWLDAYGRPAGICGVAIDITERKKAEEQLAEAMRQKETLYQFVERRHRAGSMEEIYDAALDATLSMLNCERASILLLDESGVMRFVAWRGLSEDCRKALEGHSPWKSEDPDPQPVCVPDTAAAELGDSSKTVLTDAGIGALVFIPLVVNRKLGGILTAYYKAPRPFSHEQGDSGLSIGRALALGIERSLAEKELQYLNRELENKVAARTAELERANRAILLDMEARRKLEDQLRQSQKMETIGVLAGGIAHDFNNILNIIRGYTEFLSNGPVDADETAESLRIINETIDRGSGVVQQLLTLARKNESRLELTDANRLLDGWTKLIRDTFPKTIDVKVDQTDELPPVLADPNQITQALLNLCLNARDAMPSGGTLTLATRAVDGAELTDAGEKKAEPYVSIEVKDTGMGIAEAVQNRIFDPFFTTKGTGQGTGLGLAVVYGIVKSHNGTIQVDSAPTRGTTFRLYLPAAPLAENPAVGLGPEKDALKEPRPNGCGTVLVVEDEEHIQRLLAKVLSEWGYRVLTATDGEKAIEVYRRHKNTIDVVLLDIGLPKIAGWHVFLKMKEVNPQVSVVVASGYLEPQVKTEMYQAGVKRFIHKPYRLEEVADACGDLVNRE